MKAKSLCILVLPIFMQMPSLFGQSKVDAVVNIVKSVTGFADRQLVEKIYIHTDKPYYAIGDTLWFKTYLFNAAYLNASAKSGIAYIEIADGQNKVVKRLMVAMYMGLGWGNIALNEKEFPQGNYYLRAYTNWMRNFDNHYVFEKQFSIISPGEKDMLINAKINVKDIAGKQKASIKLDLTKIDRQPVRFADFQLNIKQGNKVWYKDKAGTLIDGTIAFNFDVPEKADPGKLSITLQDLKKPEDNPIYDIPILFNRPENIDLQFMPEGGYMVAGLTNHIAFKALSEDGKGTFVSGIVYNNQQQEALSFHSTHLGIGSFNLKPQTGETYTAKIKLPDGTYSKPYALPLAKSLGLVLKVLNSLDADSLSVDIAATRDLQDVNNTYYLIGQSRGIACYGALIKLNARENKIRISKALFPTGIARLTLLDANQQPLNERIVYIDHDDYLRIHLATDKKDYTKRDSVGLDMMVADKDGKPVPGSFSVAVTDDSQIKTDSLKYNSLKTDILLASDLKGNIEDPGYYFPKKYTAEIWQHLDDLLLAQGWVNYDWKAIFLPPAELPFAAETNFSVKGRVTNAFNKPVERSKVVLLSKKPSFFRDTITDKAGMFRFVNIYPSDTPAYFIQAKNKRGKSMNVGITVEEFKPPVFFPSAIRMVPWYVNIDSTQAKTISNYVTFKQELYKQVGAHVLKEVKIIGKKVIKDSKNLNRDGGSDLAFDQEDMDKAAKMTLGDWIYKNIKRFHLGGFNAPFTYFIDGKVFHLIIDGMDIDYALPPMSAYEHQKYVKNYLDYYMAEDIKGVEVMISPKYETVYVKYFAGIGAIPGADAYLEVTTYSGSGPFMKTTPGIYLYKPIPFAPQKQFYSPKYISKATDFFADARSTIYWSTNIITDKKGKAKFSFYTSDKPGTYTVWINGCDMNGNLESTARKIIVK
ncbi:MAG TPA: hypothetical protein VIJ27_05100 [Mucilaginibacter sp.]